MSPKTSFELGEAVYVQVLHTTHQISLVDRAKEILQCDVGDSIVAYAGPWCRSVVITAAAAVRNDLKLIHMQKIKSRSLITLGADVLDVLKAETGDHLITYAGPWQNSLVILPEGAVEESKDLLYVQSVQTNGQVTLPERVRDIMNVKAGDRVSIYEGPWEGSVILISATKKPSRASSKKR